MVMEQKQANEKLDVVDVVRHGEKIIIPDSMTYSDAIEQLKMLDKLDNENIVVGKRYAAIPFDGNLALQRVLLRRYGKVPTREIKSWFGDEPPVFENVQIGPHETAQAVWGQLVIPQINQIIMVSANFNKQLGKFEFVLSSNTKRRHAKAVQDLFDEVDVELQANSVFKGQVARIAFTSINGQPLPAPQVTFIDTSTVNINELVFKKDLKSAIEANIYTPIRFAKAAKASGVPLKRGVLLAGKYGTGKTLVARAASRLAVENGVMFIYLDHLHDMPYAIRFVQSYGQAIIFAEDVDSATSGNRDNEMNALLNTLDGIDTKSGDVMVVLTTNNIEKIHPAVLRPGRIDVALHVTPPDAPAARELIRVYSRELLHLNANLELVGEMLNGEIPAVIREVVERSKLITISRTGMAVTVNSITDSDLEEAARLLIEQRKFTNPETDPNDAARPVVLRELADALTGAVADRL